MGGEQSTVDSRQSTAGRRCGMRTEVYSRVVGYYRPVQQWNRGKRAEHKDRKLFKLDPSTALRAGGGRSFDSAQDNRTVDGGRPLADNPQPAIRNRQSDPEDP